MFVTPSQRWQRCRPAYFNTWPALTLHFVCNKYIRDVCTRNALYVTRDILYLVLMAMTLVVILIGLSEMVDLVSCLESSWRGLPHFSRRLVGCTWLNITRYDILCAAYFPQPPGLPQSAVAPFTMLRVEEGGWSNLSWIAQKTKEQQETNTTESVLANYWGLLTMTITKFLMTMTFRRKWQTQQTEKGQRTNLYEVIDTISWKQTCR